MATINRDSGKIMLIRKCTCGKEAVYIVNDNTCVVKIGCSNCKRLAIAEFTNIPKAQAIQLTINTWNRMIEKELRANSKL